MYLKGKTTKRLISLLMVAAMMACIICAAVVPMSAASDDVRSVADGVLYFGMSYGNFFGGRGSCFLINEDTIITANHCTQLTKQIYDLAREQNISKEDLDANFKYTVTLARDFTITATLVNSSENMDFAILKLSQPINNRTYLTLRDSKTVMPAETVYGVGFPVSKDAFDSTAQYYNQKDMVFESGKVNKAQYTDSFNFTDSITGTSFNYSGDVIMYSGGTTSGGNSGGPVVDEDGNVIGIVSCGNAGSCYASAISQVIEILDALGIPYTSDESKPDDETTVEDEPTEEPETEAPTDPVIETTAGNNTTDGGNGWILYLIIGLAVILIAGVVVVIIVVAKKGKGNGNGPKPGAPAPGPQAPNMARPSAPQAPQAPPYAQPYNRPQMPTGSTPTVPSNEGAGETSVLNDGAGETTVLGGGQATGFSLMRKSNNESININKPEFTIGKERRRVDYCIANNNSVSRVHAKLRVRGGVCYISDLGSTNCTYVNGTKLAPNQEVALKKGDKIKISDEEFEMI